MHCKQLVAQFPCTSCPAAFRRWLSLDQRLSKSSKQRNFNPHSQSYNVYQLVEGPTQYGHQSNKSNPVWWIVYVKLALACKPKVRKFCYFLFFFFWRLRDPSKTQSLHFVGHKIWRTTQKMSRTFLYIHYWPFSAILETYNIVCTYIESQLLARSVFPQEKKETKPWKVY